MNLIENSEDYKIRVDETPNIEIVGVEGLRVFLRIIQSAWSEGQEVSLFAKEVRFIPKDNKPEHIYCEISQVVTLREQNLEGQEA